MGLTPLLSNYLIIQLSMFGSTHIMLIIKMLEWIMLNKFGKL